MEREDRVDGSLLLGQWGSERKGVQVPGIMSLSLILGLCGGLGHTHVTARAGFPWRHTEGSVLEFHGKKGLGGRVSPAWGVGIREEAC